MAQNADLAVGLSPFQQRVLKDYQTTTRKYRVRQKNAHVAIRKNLLDWLAQPVRRERYDLEVMPTHEQTELVDALVAHLQGKRTGRAAETRKTNIKLTQLQVNKARQSSFDL